MKKNQVNGYAFVVAGTSLIGPGLFTNISFLLGAIALILVGFNELT